MHQVPFSPPPIAPATSSPYHWSPPVVASVLPFAEWRVHTTTSRCHQTYRIYQTASSRFLASPEHSLYLPLYDGLWLPPPFHPAATGALPPVAWQSSPCCPSPTHSVPCLVSLVGRLSHAYHLSPLSVPLSSLLSLADS